MQVFHIITDKKFGTIPIFTNTVIPALLLRYPLTCTLVQSTGERENSAGCVGEGTVNHPHSFSNQLVNFIDYVQMAIVISTEGVLH